MSQRRTAVFVHGAWGGGAADWDMVLDARRESPIDTVAIDLPSCSRADATLADDVGHLRQTLAALDGPVTSCAHSYGGAVVTEGAPTDGQVDHLVYLAAVMPRAGDTVLEVMSRRPTDDGVELDFADDGTSMVTVWPLEDGSYRDAVIHPDTQRDMAANATTVLELDSNHFAHAEFACEIATVVAGDPPN